MVIAHCSWTSADRDQSRALSRVQHKQCTNPNCRSRRLVAVNKEHCLICIVIPIYFSEPMVTCADCRQKFLKDVHEKRGKEIQSMIMERQQHELVPMAVVQFPPGSLIAQKRTILVPRADFQKLTELQDKIIIVDVHVDGRYYSVWLPDAKLIEQSVKARQDKQAQKQVDTEEMIPLQLGGETFRVSKESAKKIEQTIMERKTSRVFVRVGTRDFKVSYDDTQYIYKSIKDLHSESLMQRQGKQGQKQKVEEMVPVQVGSTKLQVTKTHSLKIEQTILKECKCTMKDWKVHVGEQSFWVSCDDARLMHNSVVEWHYKPGRRQEPAAVEMTTLQMGKEMLRVSKEHAEKIKHTLMDRQKQTLMDRQNKADNQEEPEETTTSSELCSEPRSAVQEEMEPLPADEPDDDDEEAASSSLLYGM